MASDQSTAAVLHRIDVLTDDAERATAAFRRGFPGIVLSPSPDGPAFRFDYHRVGDGRLTANRLRLTGTAEGRGSIDPAVAVGGVRNGRFGLDYGRDVIDTSVPYLRPAGRSVARMEDAVLTLIELDTAAFEHSARRYLEGSGRVLRPPTPATARPRTPELITAWQRLSEHVLRGAFDDAAFSSPLIRAGLFDLVVAGLLATFPLTVEVGSPLPTQMQPAALRRALAHIEDHLAEPLDPAAIADAARVSVRGLQSAFRRELGVSPMEHVRRRRLSAAHDELVAADPGGDVTVAAIAQRWGFPHLSRFARLHREVYRENPSTTLRRDGGR